MNLRALESAQGFDHQTSANDRELRTECFGGVVCGNWKFPLHQDIPRVKAGIDAHRGCSGDRFPLCDRPLNRRGATILRQQRSVQVEISKTREIDHPLRDDAAITDDNDRVGTELRKLLAKFFVVLDLAGLDDLNAQADGGPFDGRNRQFHSAAPRPVRLRNHQRHGMPTFDQFFKGRNSKTRRAAENQNHKC